MAGLDLFGAGNGDDSEDLFPGNAGALGAISQQPDFAAAIALLSGHGGGMPTNQSQSMIDAFRQRYTGILPKADELQKARQQWEQSAYQAQDPRTKWLQFASGLLSPTHTGTFGESLGYGLKGLAEGQNRENQMAAQVAQQRFGNMMGLEKFGMEGARLDAMLAGLQQRMMRPSPEAIKAASRADASGAQRGTPQWDAFFKNEMDKGQFLTNLTPDLRSHLYNQGNPDTMTIDQMRKITGDRQKEIDNMKKSEFGQKTNPLFTYGVEDPSIFDNLEGESLKQALQAYPALASNVEALRSGRITEAQLRAGRSSSGTVPYLVSLATRIDPNYSTARNKLTNSFYAGDDAKNITGLNTVMGHLGTWFDLADAMKSGNPQAINAIVNKVKTWAGHSEVNNAKMAALAVSQEMMKAFRGNTGASQNEAEAFEKLFKPEFGSGTQMQDAGGIAAGLIHSRGEAVNDKWKRAMNEDFSNLYSDKAQAVFGRAQPFMRRAGTGGKLSPAQTWIENAISANPEHSRDEVIAEGKRRGKVPQDFKE